MVDGRSGSGLTNIWTVDFEGGSPLPAESPLWFIRREPRGSRLEQGVVGSRVSGGGNDALPECLCFVRHCTSR